MLTRTKVAAVVLTAALAFSLLFAACDAAPVVSGVSPSTSGATSELVYWVTDVASSSQVLYGLTTAYGSTTTLDSTGRTAHLQNVTGLAPNTLYHFKVQSTTASSSMGSSPDGTFTTARLPVAATSGPSSCPLNNAGRACWASHTGVPGLTEAQIVADQTELTHVVGDLTVTVDGTVIDKQWRDGCIAIRANNVTIKNSLIRTTSGCFGGDGGAAGSAINTGNGGVTGLQVIDSEVDAGNTGPSYDYVGIGATNYSLLRVNAHGARHTLWMGYNTSAVDSYIHEPANNSAPTHTEAIDADSGTFVTVDHSYVDMANNCNSPQCTGAIFFGGHWSVPNHLTVKNSYLQAGCATCSDNGKDITLDPNATYVTFTGNHWAPWETGFAYWTAFQNPTTSFSVWSGNVWSETGAAYNVL